MKRFRILLYVSFFLIISQSVSVINGLVKQKPHRHSSLASFYDLKTNRTFRPPIVSFGEEDELRQAATPATTGNGFNRRCDCKMTDNRNVCSCCAGLKLPRIRFQREVCTRFQYNLSQRNQMLMDVTMNGNAVGSQTFNFKAPDAQPLCVPLPIPLVPLRFDFCIKVFDVNFMGQNAHFCMDWSARVEMAPLILLHFDCAQFGSEGVSLLKPGQLPQQPEGGFPSVLQPGVVDSSGIGGLGGGGGGGIVSPVNGGGAIVPPANGGTGPSTFPVNPPQSITNPVNGPDENGNLPQVGGDDGDFDQVDDLKHKKNTVTSTTPFPYNKYW